MYHKVKTNTIRFLSFEQSTFLKASNSQWRIYKDKFWKLPGSMFFISIWPNNRLPPPNQILDPPLTLTSLNITEKQGYCTHRYKGYLVSMLYISCQMTEIKTSARIKNLFKGKYLDRGKTIYRKTDVQTYIIFMQN